MSTPTGSLIRCIVTAALAVSVTTVSACANASDGHDKGTSGALPGPSAPADPATSPPAPPASPGTKAGGSGGGPIEDLPASWKLCQNPIRGTSMGYPGDWFTTSLTPSEKCSQFHPTAFTIPVAGEYPLTALNAVQSTDSAATYLDSLTDPFFSDTLVNESATVAGLPATRFEVSSTGEGLYEAGTRRYGYVIDRGGKAFVLWTVARPGESRYADWKFIVDTAKGTLRFL